jgi:hypothetical protein
MDKGAYSKGPGSGIYEAGDQRNAPQSEQPQPTRFEEGVKNSHQTLDSKDERSIKNRLAAAERRGDSDGDDVETAQSKRDPEMPARMHGNEPSKGAKIDADLKREEQEELERKGRA